MVVNADDMGMVASVNAGIAESIERGVVTSTSLMVNMPGFDDAAARLKQMVTSGLDFGVGLHFNVVAGNAVSGVSSMTDPRGRFRSLSGQMLNAYLGRIDPDDVRTELLAQLQRARECLAPLGLEVTHIDSHRHAHCLPGFHDVVRDCARSGAVSHVRNPVEAPRLRIRRSTRGSVLQLLLGSRAPFDAIGFAGVSAMASATFENDVLSILDRLPEGTTELMVHPGHDSEQLGMLDNYRTPREAELQALTSERVKAHIASLGIQLVHFGK